MPPTPKEEEKKKSGTKEENSMPNDRERTKDEEEEALANAFMATSLAPSTGFTNEVLAATGSGDEATDPDDPPCDGCKQPFAGTMRCGQCESVFYCGRDCQVAHWSAGGHKKECELLKKKNEETAKRVLENFEDVQCWEDLDDTGAYNAAVRQGLHHKIREVLELDKTKIVDRYQNGRGGGEFYRYTPHVMDVLFRGQRAEGRTTTSPTDIPVVVYGHRIEGYVRSHRDALDTWLEASVQLLRDVTDRATLPYPFLHCLAHEATDAIWLKWTMVFANPTATRAILSPFPSPTTKGATSGGESAEMRRKRVENHVRRIVMFFGEAMRLNWGRPDSDLFSLYSGWCLVCALVLVRTQEYGIGIDVEGILDVERQKVMFQFICIPMAKQIVEKGAMMNEEEFNAAFDVAERQLEIRFR